MSRSPLQSNLNEPATAVGRKPVSHLIVQRIIAQYRRLSSCTLRPAFVRSCACQRVTNWCPNGVYGGRLLLAECDLAFSMAWGCLHRSAKQLPRTSNLCGSDSRLYSLAHKQSFTRCCQACILLAVGSADCACAADSLLDGPSRSFVRPICRFVYRKTLCGTLRAKRQDYEWGRSRTRLRRIAAKRIRGEKLRTSENAGSTKNKTRARNPTSLGILGDANPADGQYSLRASRDVPSDELNQDQTDTTFMLPATEEAVLRIFQQFLVTPGEMLCFHGKWLEEHATPLRRLTERKMVTKEDFTGGYSLTKAGYAHLKADGTPANES